jgi:hypothetical protein
VEAVETIVVSGSSVDHVDRLLFIIRAKIERKDGHKLEAWAVIV